MYKTMKYEKRGTLAIATISRPEALNALNMDVLADLSAVIDEVEADSELRCLIITGEGRAFVAGADIVAQSKLDMAGARAFGNFGAKLYRRIETLRIPVIAAVNGYALGGGCELALCCDVIIASEKAKFGLPEVGLGITPGYSGTTRLMQRVGIGKAKELAFSAKMITAAEAEKIGLANEICPPEELMDRAAAMAESFMKNGPIAVALAKDQINRAVSMDMESAINMDVECYVMCFASSDQKEGMAAFLEKRKPDFKGI